jgi:serine/threonine protein kinase
LELLGSSANLLPGPQFLAATAGSSALPSKPAPLPLSSILSIGIHIAQGLAYLHAAKIAHGNLKPSNILLVAQRNDLEASPTAASASPRQQLQPQLGGGNGPTGSTQAFSQAIHKRLVAEMDVAQGPLAASRMLVLQAASLGDELFTVKLSGGKLLELATQGTCMFHVGMLHGWLRRAGE